MAELKEWAGHKPRDRASVWYLAPLFMQVGLAAMAILILVAVLGG